MAEIINLRTARKRQAKAQKAARAQENRLKFGQTKHAKDLAATRSSLADKKLSAHKLED